MTDLTHGSDGDEIVVRNDCTRQLLSRRVMSTVSPWVFSGTGTLRDVHVDVASLRGYLTIYGG
jgi:hypothetical protein